MRPDRNGGEFNEEKEQPKWWKALEFATVFLFVFGMMFISGF